MLPDDFSLLTSKTRGSGAQYWFGSGAEELFSGFIAPGRIDFDLLWKGMEKYSFVLEFFPKGSQIPNYFFNPWSQSYEYFLEPWEEYLNKEQWYQVSESFWTADLAPHAIGSVDLFQEEGYFRLLWNERQSSPVSEEGLAALSEWFRFFEEKVCF